MVEYYYIDYLMNIEQYHSSLLMNSIVKLYYALLDNSDRRND